eukprot:2921604-Prorocentrum_lima.AAC.1
MVSATPSSTAAPAATRPCRIAVGSHDGTDLVTAFVARARNPGTAQTARAPGKPVRKPPTGANQPPNR